MPYTRINLKSLTMTLLCLLALSVFSLPNAKAQESQKLIPVALKGYDAVSYFSGDSIRKGSNEYQTMYRGKRYVFVSEENQQLFSSNPDHFLPQLGGFCAHNATQSSPVASDPSIFLIDQGKLYQFSDLDAKKNWSNKLDESKVGLVPLALEGYDVTSYFGNTGPTLGKEAFQAVYNGKRYIFANQANQKKFAASPEIYLPQFDGYCAHSISEGTPMVSKPDLFAIDKGKLLLFSSDEAKSAWEKAPSKTIADANKYWELTNTKRNNKIAAKNLWKKENKVKLFTF